MSFLNKIFRGRDDEESDGLSIYKDEPATNRFASFLFGFFALFVTLLIASGLFFGGRAVYRALNGSSNGQVSNPGNENDTNAPKQNTSPAKSKSTASSTVKKAKKPASTPSTGDNLPLPATGDPGM